MFLPISLPCLRHVTQRGHYKRLWLCLDHVLVLFSKYVPQVSDTCIFVACFNSRFGSAVDSVFLVWKTMIWTVLFLFKMRSFIECEQWSLAWMKVCLCFFLIFLIYLFETVNILSSAKQWRICQTRRSGGICRGAQKRWRFGGPTNPWKKKLL